MNGYSREMLMGFLWLLVNQQGGKAEIDCDNLDKINPSTCGIKINESPEKDRIIIETEGGH